MSQPESDEVSIFIDPQQKTARFQANSASTSHTDNENNHERASLSSPLLRENQEVNTNTKNENFKKTKFLLFLIPEIKFYRRQR